MINTPSPQVKEYTKFVKLTSNFQKDCKKKEDEIKTVTENIEEFQKKTDEWIKIQLGLAKTQPELLSIRPDELIEFMKKATELSKAMTVFYDLELKYGNGMKTFCSELTERINLQDAYKLMADLPRNKTFVKKNHSILTIALADLKVELLRLKKMKEELEGIYRRSFN